MRFLSKRPFYSGLFILIAANSGADALYTVDSSELIASALFDQEITENTLVTVKPVASASATGDVQVLDQCLWSVGVTLESGSVTYTAGKMICVGPMQEVLESEPVGEFEEFGQCADSCERITVKEGEEVVLKLSEALEFNLQPRNERK
jgi:hypothetical protein